MLQLEDGIYQSAGNYSDTKVDKSVHSIAVHHSGIGHDSMDYNTGIGKYPLESQKNLKISTKRTPKLTQMSTSTLIPISTPKLRPKRTPELIPKSRPTLTPKSTPKLTSKRTP